MMRFPGSRVAVSFDSGWFEVEMQQHGLLRPLKAAELSDGTLRYLLWVAALLTPRPPGLLVLNEPETSLHPDLLPALGRLIAQTAGRSQVLVVSHAPTLIDALQQLPECHSIIARKEVRRNDIGSRGRARAVLALAGAMRLLLWNAGWIFAVVAVVPGHVQDTDFWSFLEPGRVVTRCAESSAAHTQASTRLDRLNRRIEQLGNADSPSSAVDELHALLRSECFLPAAETTRAPRPDTTESLKQWWIEGDGRDWLASFLQLPRFGPADALTPHIVVPADARKTLGLNAHRDHPLQRFLCASNDTACGAVTRGWKLRADASFDAHRALGRNDLPAANGERPASGVTVTSRECAEQASSGDSAHRYQAWRSCIESRRPRRVALPLGEFKAPADGWIVVSGRRGHYDFCDTTRAYDLATGAAFISDSCSGLALKRDGHVDIERHR